MSVDDHEADAEQLLRRGGDPVALAATFRARALVPYEVAARLMETGDESAVEVANLVLSDAQELAIDPVMRLRGLDPTDRAWAIQRVVGEELALRADVARWLSTLSSDRTLLEGSRRLCDEAFLALRQLVGFEEHALGEGFDAAKYWDASPAERDTLITAAVRSESMKRLASTGG